MKLTCRWLSLAAVAVALFVSSCGDGVQEESLILRYWQAPSTANPYLAEAFKDLDAAALVLEPLANYSEDGRLTPRLATAIPSVDNGGIPEDLTAITWELKPGILWSDGTPFTAHDAVFTWRYRCSLPDFDCGAESEAIRTMEAIDDLTLRITFKYPVGFPYDEFVGFDGGKYILQKSQFEGCMGEASRTAEACRAANLAPIGTGPYRIVSFQIDETAGTSVVVYERNEHFRVPGQPFFSEVTIQGGGTAEDAVQAVLAGDADYAWRVQILPETRQRLEEAEHVTVAFAFSTLVERLLVNFTNPDPALGAKSSEWSYDDPNPHPFLSDPAVREALSLAIDRGRIVDEFYGPTGQPACNIITRPALYASPNNDDCLIQDIEAARMILEDAGWRLGEDGTRQKNGVRLSLLYQTSTNDARQGTQALIQEWWEEIGVETALKNIDASYFFAPYLDPNKPNDPNPDSVYRFLADIQMFADISTPDHYVTAQVPRPENDWLGTNIPRWSNAEYDEIFAESLVTPLGPRRRQQVIAMNDLLVQNHALIPLVDRASVVPFLSELKGVRTNAWDSEMWNIHEWYRE